MSRPNAYELVNAYVQVVNRAIHANGDRFPFSQILDVGDRMLEDKTLGIAVYEDDPGSPDAYYAMQWRNGKFELHDGGKSPSEGWSWRLSRRYLEQVAEDPGFYIGRPIRLDWHWLIDRFGSILTH